jgi:hypothetical protein
MPNRKKIDRGRLPRGRGHGSASLVYRSGRAISNRTAPWTILAARGKPGSPASRILPQRHGQDSYTLSSGRRPGSDQGCNVLPKYCAARLARTGVDRRSRSDARGRGRDGWNRKNGMGTVARGSRLFEHGIMPLYTPVGGSWLNMAESIQRILKRRALDGQHPTNVSQIMKWFESVTAHWNASPTPFEWAGHRAARRQRQRERRHRIGGSGACTQEPVNRGKMTCYGYAQSD